MNDFDKSLVVPLDSGGELMTTLLAATPSNYYEDVASRTYATGNTSFNEQPALNNSTPALYQVPMEIVVVLSLCYGSISTIAVIGNVFVIWIISTSRHMHSATNCYIANLACADITISLFAIPFQFQAALLQRWNLPEFMCSFCPFVQVLSYNVSIFTLTAIAVDRYCAIINPLKHRISKIRVKGVIATIWLVGSASGAPYAVALRVTHVPDEVSGGTKPFCQNMLISDDIWNTYNHLLVTLQYVIPLVVISYAYLRIVCVLWGAKIPGNAQGQRDATLLRNKKKVIKMLLVVVALFAICWIPLQLYQILQGIYPEVNRYQYINIVWFSSHWLAMSNSCCNPFIYGIYNERFKREFRTKIRHCCLCSKKRNSNFANAESNTNSVRLSVKFHSRQSKFFSSHNNDNPAKINATPL